MTLDLNKIDGLEVNWTSSENMASVANGSVQSIITSPPYWDLKDYGHDGQIGRSDQSYEEYHDRMSNVWKECYGVLRSDGTMWIVVDTVMKRGDLQLLPQHIVERCEDIGFRLQDVVVWYKPTAIAGMTDRNVVNKKEYIIYLSKESNHKFNQLEQSENGKEDPAINGNGCLGNLWRFPVKRGTVGQNVLHKAPYPASLINRIVKLSTDPGDIVLDPFLGSGTTAYSALDLERQCIGYELNTEFREIIADRLSDLHQRSLTEFYET
jgi:site-specific DNA-methyltransferase (adenine-specific)